MGEKLNHDGGGHHAQGGRRRARRRSARDRAAGTAGAGGSSPSRRARGGHASAAPAVGLADVLTGVYEAALDPGRWPAAVERAATLVGAEKGMLFAADPGGRDVAIQSYLRLDPAGLDRWRREYVRECLWTQALGPREAGFVVTGASLIPPSEFRRSFTYNEVHGPNGIEDLLCASIFKAGDVHAVLSLYAGKIFERAELDVMRQIAPHLRLAVRLQTQIGELRARAESAEAALDALTLGVLALDGRGRVLRANRSAEAMLARGDGLGVREGRLRCARSEEGALLESAVGRAAEAARARRAAEGAALAVSRPSRLRPFALLVAPVLRTESETALLAEERRRRAAVVVTVSDPEARAEVPPARLVRLFALTPAEARLAAALAAGATVEEHAARAGISAGTARWTLKRVLEKTDCHRQSELVRLIVTSVAARVREGEGQ